MGRFTRRFRLNTRDANAALARPGMSGEIAIAVSDRSNPAPIEAAARLGCSFDPAKHMLVEQLPPHPGLGRALPQGVAGTAAPAEQPG